MQVVSNDIFGIEKTQEPSNQHQKPAQILIRINADNNSLRRLLLFILSFFLIWILILLIYFFTPQIYHIKTNQTQLNRSDVITKCENPYGFENGVLVCGYNNVTNKVGLVLRDITQANQLIILYLKFHKKQKQSRLSINQTLIIDVYSIILSQSQHNKQKVFRMDKHVHHLQVQFQLDNQKISTEHIIGYFHRLKHHNYLITIQFTQPHQNNISSFKPSSEAYVVNPYYTIYMITIRMICFFWSVIGFIIFLYKYRALNNNNNLRIKQQKYILILSISLLFFNDPLYSFTLLNPEPINTFFSFLFLIQMVPTFFIILFLMYRNISNQQCNLTYKILQLILFIITLVLFLVLFLVIQINDSYFINPFLSKSSEYLFIYKFIFLILLCIMSCVLTSGMIIRYFTNNILWRHKLLLSYSCLFILVIFLVISVQLTQISPFSSQILMVYISLNLYVTHLQYMFMVPSQQLQNYNNFNSLKTESQMLTILSLEMVNDNNVDVDLNECQLQRKQLQLIKQLK